MAEVVLRDVCKNFDGHTAVDQMNLHVRDGEFFVILGPSGAGKTTTLKMIAGVEDVSRGEILIDDRPVNHLAPEHRNVAMVFESYALYSHLSVFENIAFPLRAPAQKPADTVDIEAKVRRVAALLRIDMLLDRHPSQLSGGQRQRVALGRALVREPDVFLLDEPLSHLDAKIRHQMRGEFKTLREKMGSTIIYVTHDYDEALALGDRVAILHRGCIQCVDKPDQLYRRPPTVLVARLLGDPAMNFFDGLIAHGGRLHLQNNGGTRTYVPREHHAEVRLREFVNNRVTVGIRPQYLNVESRPSGDFHLAGNVFAREILGDEVVLIIAAGQQHIKAMVKPSLPFGPNDKVYITWNPTDMHIFLTDTGKRLPDS
jgi:multiple sugar transport system ATP-binding protein